MQVGFKLGGRLIRQCRVQPLAIIDLFDEAADHFLCLMGVAVAAPVYFLLLERLHEALRFGVVVGVADAAHAGPDAVRFQHRRVVAASILNTAIGVMDEAAGHGMALLNGHVQRIDGEARVQMRVQRPATTRRLNASSTTARNANSSCSRIKVMSATQSWSRPVVTRPRARLGTTRQPWRESVVAGTKARFLRHSRLSSRIKRSTRLWFTAKPSRRSSSVILR